MPENLQPLCKNGRTDPTVNVTNMLHEAVKRQDDLRGADIRYNDKQFITVSDMFIAVAKKFDDVDVKYQIQFSAAKEALGIALVAQEKATAQALDGTKEAIIKNDANTDKRFDLLSEKIDSIAETMSKNTGAQGIYVTHTDLSIAMDKLQAGIEATLRPLVTFMNSQQGGAKSTNMVWVYIGLGVTTLGAIGALILTALRLSGLGL